MKKLIFASVVVVIASPASAQWEPPSEVLQVLGKGEGAWSVTCEWQSKKGKPMNREIKGGGKNWQRLHIMEPASGRCTYQAAADKPLLLSVKSPLYYCPLPSPTAKSCEQSFPGGTSGQFDIRPRG